MIKRWVWVLLFVAACGSAEPTVPAVPATPPADFAVTYDWREGSVPPPYHDEYTITFDAQGQAEIRYSPDYSSAATPVWTHTWTLTPEQIQSFYDVLREHTFFTTPWREPDQSSVGGSNQRIEVLLDGKIYQTPFEVRPNQQAALEPVYAAIQSLVPQAIWDQIKADRQIYIDTFKE